MAAIQPSMLSAFDRKKPLLLHSDCVGFDTVRDGLVYRSVRDWPCYRVGDDGSAWGRRRTRYESEDGNWFWRRLNPCRHTGGYLQVHFYEDSKRTPKFIHRLVLETFVGPCPKGMEACHNDGDRANNRLSNLRWDTRTRNHADKAVHGTLLKGSAVGGSKLHELVIPAIRALEGMGVEQWKIAEAFGVEQTLISMIAKRRIWKHVRDGAKAGEAIRQMLIEFSEN